MLVHAGIKVKANKKLIFVKENLIMKKILSLTLVLVVVIAMILPAMASDSLYQLLYANVPTPYISINGKELPLYHRILWGGTPLFPRDLTAYCGYMDLDTQQTHMYKQVQSLNFAPFYITPQKEEKIKAAITYIINQPGYNPDAYSPLIQLTLWRIIHEEQFNSIGFNVTGNVNSDIVEKAKWIYANIKTLIKEYDVSKLYVSGLEFFVYANPKTVVSVPPRKLGAAVVTNFINAGFHCNANGGNGRVWIDAYDKEYKDNKNEGLDGVLVDLIPLEDNYWLLDNQKDYKCPQCGSNVWVSYSNMSGVPDGKNIQFNHPPSIKEEFQPLIKFKVDERATLTNLNWNNGNTSDKDGANGAGIISFSVNGVTLKNNKNYVTPDKFAAEIQKTSNVTNPDIYTVTLRNDNDNQKNPYVKVYDIKVAFFRNGAWQIYVGTITVDNPGGNDNKQIIDLKRVQ